MSRPQDPLPGPWFVLIEETVSSGDSKRWALTYTNEFEDWPTARRTAAKLARDYRPRHPSSPRGRVVYKVGEHVWVVHVAGAVSEFHFRVSIARAGLSDEDLE